MTPREIFKMACPDQSSTIYSPYKEGLVITLENFFKREDGIRVDYLISSIKPYKLFAILQQNNAVVYTWYTVPMSNGLPDETLEVLGDLQCKIGMPLIGLQRQSLNHINASIHMYTGGSEPKPLLISNRKYIFATGTPVGITLPINTIAKSKQPIKKSKVTTRLSSKFDTAFTVVQQEAARFDFDKSVRLLPDIEIYIGDLK